jgi:hypothetical protein
MFQEDALILVCMVAVWPAVKAISRANVVVEPVFPAPHSPVLVIFREDPTKLIFPVLFAVIVIGAADGVDVLVPGIVPSAPVYARIFPFMLRVLLPSATFADPPVLMCKSKHDSFCTRLMLCPVCTYTSSSASGIPSASVPETSVHEPAVFQLPVVTLLRNVAPPTPGITRAVSGS